MSGVRVRSKLILKGNPWVTPPEGVEQEAFSAVQTCLQDLHATTNAGVDIQKTNHLKVVLVGASQAGKTR